MDSNQSADIHFHCNLEGIDIATESADTCEDAVSDVIKFSVSLIMY